MQTNRPNQLQLPKTKDVFTQGSRPLIPWCRQKRLGCSHWILETGLCTQMLVRCVKRHLEALMFQRFVGIKAVDCLWSQVHWNQQESAHRETVPTLVPD